MNIWIRIAEKVGARGKRFVLALAWLCTIPIVVADVLTGPLPWSGFYLMPLGLIGWVVGIRAALAYSVVVPTFAYVGWMMLPGEAPEWLTIWFLPLRMLALVIFSFIFSGLQEVLKRERDHVAHLRQLNAELDRFAFAASHDLQSPLNRIISFIDLARQDQPPGSRSGHFLDRAAASALRMRQLVTDLLTFARIGRKDFAPTDLNDIAQKVMEDLETPINDTKARVQRSTLPTVTVVRSDFYQLILNLVANSIRYRRPGVEPEIEIKGGVHDGSAWLEVKDNGRGIAEKDRQTIFKPFERGAGGTAEGTGIGLAICAKVAENHHGRLSVESRPGEGSTFRLEFPKTPAANPPTA